MAQQRPRRSDANRSPHKSRPSKGSGTLILVLLLVLGGGAAALYQMGLLPTSWTQAEQQAKGAAAAAGAEFRKLTDTPPGPAAGGPGVTGPSGTPGTPATPGGSDPGSTTGGGPSTPSADPRVESSAKQKLSLAGDHFAAGRFREAVDLVDGVLAVPKGLGAPLEQELRAFRRLAHNHWLVSKDFHRDQRIDGQVTILKLVDGTTIEVRITREADGKIDYVWKGIRSSMELSRVLSRTTLTDAERVVQDKQKLDEHLKEAKGGGPRAYLAVIKFCVERDLRDRIPGVIAEAQREPSRGGFFEDLFETQSALLFQRYLALTSRPKERQEVRDRILRDFSETVVARELSKYTAAQRPVAPSPEQEQLVQKEIEKTLEAPKTTGARNAQVREILAEADALYNKAQKEFRLGFPGQPDADSHIKNAERGLLAAQQKYEKAYEMEPSSAIEEKITYCQRDIYACRKQAKIGGMQ